MSPGIYNMSNADYHGAEGISKSGLDLIAKSPAHYRYAQDNPRPETPAMQKGTAVHTMVLEPNLFNEHYASLPEDMDSLPLPEGYVVLPSNIKQRRGKDYDAFAAAHAGETIILPSEVAKVKKEVFQAANADKVFLSAEQIADIQAIAEAVRGNPVAMKILENANAIEQSIFAHEFETGVLCKCRPDITLGNTFYDLKTTRNANARSFSYSCRNYRYHVQAAFYMDVAKMAGIDVDQFGFIAVDTDAMPYQCTVFHRLHDDAMGLGRREYMDDLRVYAHCLETGEWPGYPDQYDVLTLAGYAFTEDDLDAETDLDMDTTETRPQGEMKQSEATDLRNKAYRVGG